MGLERVKLMPKEVHLLSARRPPIVPKAEFFVHMTWKRIVQNKLSRFWIQAFCFFSHGLTSRHPYIESSTQDDRLVPEVPDPFVRSHVRVGEHPMFPWLGSPWWMGNGLPSLSHGWFMELGDSHGTNIHPKDHVEQPPPC